jgi:hypothetical protein
MKPDAGRVPYLGGLHATSDIRNCVSIFGAVAFMKLSKNYFDFIDKLDTHFGRYLGACAARR